MMTGSGDTRVWDPLVRIVHWLLVVAFFTAYFVEPEESSIHVLAGYIVLALVLVKFYGASWAASTRGSPTFYIAPL